MGTEGLRLQTGRQVAAFYFSSGSGRIVTAAALAVTVARLWVAATESAMGFGLGDLASVLFVVVMVGPVEWMIHTWLLHAPPTSIRTRWFATSTAHRQHHRTPASLDHILLLPGFALLFVVVIAVTTATFSVPLTVAIGWSTGEGADSSMLLASYGSALLASLWALVHYEWVHLLIHSQYKPRTRYYRRLARNHRLHHYRNEDYWLGVSSNLGDRFFGTLPKSKGDVPISDTAKSL